LPRSARAVTVAEPARPVALGLLVFWYRVEFGTNAGLPSDALAEKSAGLSGVRAGPTG
jgi:hypothetical protein